MDNARRARTLLAFTALCTCFAGCGGGGSGSSGERLPADEPIDPGSTGAGGQTAGIASDVPTSSPGTVTLPDEGALPEAARGGDASALAADGREVRVVAAVGGPAIGLPGATIAELGDVAARRADRLAYPGTARTRDGEDIEGLWAGSALAPRLLLSTGSELSGTAGPRAFDSAREVRLAADGSLAWFVKFDGDDRSSAVAVTRAGETTIVVDGDTPLDTPVGPRTLDRLWELSHGDAGTAFNAWTTELESTLWLARDGSLEFVAMQEDREVDVAPRIGPCRIYLGDETGIGTVEPVVLDSGALLFRAELRNHASRTGPCEPREAIVRYDRSGHRVLVAEGDRVPGTRSATFGRPTATRTDAAGQVLVSADVYADEGRGPRAFSQWLYPETGEPRLLKLEGESVSLSGGRSDEFGVGVAIRTNEAGDLVAKADFIRFDVDDRIFALFAGRGHDGQPYPDPGSPGAAALDLVVDSLSEDAPVACPKSIAFEALGDPAVDESGRPLFAGCVPLPGGAVAGSVWRADLQGAMERIVGPEDAGPVNGSPTPLLELLSASERRDATDVRIEPLDGGAMLLTDAPEGQSSETIVYVGPSPDER